MRNLALADYLLELRGAIENLEDAVKIRDFDMIREYRQELFSTLEKQKKSPKIDSGDDHNIQDRILLPLIQEEITYGQSILCTSSVTLSSSLSVV
jgi:hypothetical protein